MTPLVMLVVLAVVGWFAAGSLWNVRRGSATMRWMQTGLPLLGEKTTVRWLGTSAVELGIQRAKPPFAEVVLVIFLEARDVPWLWALGRSRGRRDTLIVRGVLRAVPPRELDAVDARSWSGRDAMQRAGAGQWGQTQVLARTVPLLLKDDAAAETAQAFMQLTSEAGMEVRRLSIHRNQPNLHLHIDLPDLTTDALVFFEAVRRIGERALG